MNTLKSTIRRAQQISDRWQTPIAVLDLNPHYCPLYVIRQWDDSYADNPDLVHKVIPC